MFRYSFSEAIPIIILLHGKFLQFDWLREVVFQLNLKYLFVKITNLVWVTVRVVSEIYKKALKVQILNEVALIQVVRKRVSFQDRKNENTPKFPSIKI